LAERLLHSGRVMGSLCAYTRQRFLLLWVAAYQTKPHGNNDPFGGWGMQGFNAARWPSREGRYLVHDDEVDGVLLRVLVVQEEHAVALWVVPLKVLHSTGEVDTTGSGQSTCTK